jgi:CRP/FNR family transcriptional regulator
VSLKDIIKSHDFFSSLNEEQVDILVSIVTIHNCEKGYIYNYEHSQSDELLFLVSGLARSYKLDKYDNEVFLYYIYENSMISEISDLNASSFQTFSNIELIEDSQVLSVKYEKFKKCFLDNNILCKALNQEIVKRSLQLQSLINREFIFDAVSKVSLMLDDDLQMFNKLKRHDISTMLHIQPATLSRVLNRLKRNKIIDIIHGQVKVLDVIALQEIYKDKVDE